MSYSKISIFIVKLTLLNMRIILKSIKYIFILTISVISLIFFLFLVDATDYDNKYVNRSKVEISYIHLNSRYSYKFANFLRKTI